MKNFVNEWNGQPSNNKEAHKENVNVPDVTDNNRKSTVSPEV